jgi:hypothetical protein
MYTLYKDRWILDANGVAVAQRCRGTTNEQWFRMLRSMCSMDQLEITTEQFYKINP